jgi:hypothetical protein
MERDLKYEITERWMKAIEYLIEKEILKSYVDLEIKTGILNQRVADYKRYVKTKTRPSYVSVDQVLLVHEKFGVSLEYVICGHNPIMDSEKTHNNLRDESNISMPSTFQNYINTIENSGRITIIERKINAIEQIISEMLKNGD